MSEQSEIRNPNSAIRPRRPLALVILDGWGYSPRREGNAVALAHTPFYDEISKKYPKTLLQAAGARVGLKEGAPGNSEAGHLNIGAGRVVEAKAARIDRAVRGGEFFENPVLLSAMRRAKAREGAALHLVGLVSDGGVHSSPEHLFALLRMAKKIGLEKVFIHAILDGRDVPPGTADIYAEALEVKLAEIGVGRVATLCGRHFAMDKDQHWERTARAYTMLVHAEGERATDAVAAIRASYLRGVTDEFIEPIILEETPAGGAPVATVRDGDTVIFFNHRADRVRQLVKALSVSDGEGSSPGGGGGAVRKPQIETVCLTDYDRTFLLPVAFPAEGETNVLAQVFARRGILNCRLTETEKYAHVTYFFNGGVEVEHPCEQRLLVPSPRLARAELQPEMGCFKVTDRLLRGLEAGENDVFIVNLAAPDLVAHSGNLNKTIEAVQHVDTCLGGIVRKIRAVGGVAVITSDHGNCEEMIDLETGERHNSHTRNPVPFHLVDDRADGLRLLTDGALEDVAPTILGILGIEKPAEMTGRDLRMAN